MSKMLELRNNEQNIRNNELNIRFLPNFAQH